MTKRIVDYYNKTALQYDGLHAGDQNLEHVRALELSWPSIDRFNIKSAIDVGCGTGRTLDWMAKRNTALELTGIDPSDGLLAIARDRVPQAKLEVGCGEKIPLKNNSVDLALASAIMHHVDRPEDVIKEMFRVAKKLVFISDHNNFAFGGKMARGLRLVLYSVGLLSVATYLKQGLRKQGYSEEDGWWYPYSLFNDFGLIASLSSETYIIPTRPSNSAKGNLLLTQSHFAILAVKLPSPGTKPSAAVDSRGGADSNPLAKRE